MKRVKKLTTIMIIVLKVTSLCAVSIDDPNFVFPSVLTQTKAVAPSDYLSYAPTMPAVVKNEVGIFVAAQRSLIQQLLGVDKMPYADYKEEDARNKEALAKLGFVPFPSDSNYVFIVPQIPGYVLKFVRPKNRMANAAKKADMELELNTMQAEKNEQKREALAKTFLNELDARAQKPALKLYETYQAASVFVAMDRIEKTKKKYVLDRVFVAKTYPYLFNSNELPYDRNLFLVQEYVKGTRLTDPALLDRVSSDPQLREQFKELLKQLFVLTLAAKLWNINDILITDSMNAMPISLAPVDVEKRDRYVKSFIDVGESKHLVQIASEQMGTLLKDYPEFFAVWEDLIMRDKELQMVLLEAPHVAQLFPRLRAPQKKG